jgi:PAS domain S-box-containing protein
MSTPKSPVFTGLLMVVLILTAVFFIDREEIRLHHQHSRAQVAESLDTTQLKLELALNNRLTLVQGLVAFVKSRDEITEENFLKFAEQLQGLHKGVISLQLAPKAIVTFVTEKEKNKKAIGHNLLGDPKRRKSVLKAINNREYIISGPINLIQGSKALIGRWPIFKIDPTISLKQETFWGFATILIDLKVLLEEAGLLRDRINNLHYTLRDDRAIGTNAPLIWGNKSLFQKNSVITKIKLPSGSWQLAAHPINGWDNYWAGRNWFWFAGLILAILAGWAVYTLLNQPIRLRRTIKQTTEALQLSEARLTGAVDTLQEAFALYDPDDRLIMCNEKYLELHDNVRGTIKPGMHFEELVRANITAGAFPKAIGREEEVIKERLEYHHNPTGPEVRELADGTWYIINKTRTPDGGCCITNIDITEIKKAEIALQQSEERFRTIIDTCNQGVLVHRDYKVIYANQTFVEMYGYDSLDELLILESTEMLIAPGTNRAHAHEGQMKGALNPTDIEYQGIKKDGSTFWVGKRSFGIFWDGGPASCSFRNDVSKNKNVEAELQKSEALFRGAIECLHEGFALYDINDRLVVCNEEFRRLHPEAQNILVPGMRYEDMLKNNIEKGIIPGAVGREEEYLAERLELHRNPPGPIVREWADGTWRLIKESKTPDGGIAVSQTDITELKKLEKLKSEFISTVSHELRTPLTSIQGAIGLLKGGAIEELSPDVMKLLDIAGNNSERLTHLINDILDIEKIEAGKMEFNMTALNLYDLVAATIEANTLYGKKHNVDFMIADTIPDAKVFGDADRLSQVLTNLLSNAAKFSAGADRVEVSITSHSNAYRVSVIDHGMGITPEFRKQIFQKFAQSDATDARQKGGSGLGLNISKSIIERHGGTIDFESTPDEGSIFYFELPSYGQQIQASESSQDLDSAPQILVCEDDKDTAHLLQLMLQNNGFHADIAYDTAQTKRILKQKSYAALTVDINLPDQDGISLIKELGEIRTTKHLPIVIVSADPPDETRELSGNVVNIVDWLQKPIDQNLLKTYIKKALKQNESA